TVTLASYLPASVVVAGLAGEHDTRRLPRDQHARLDGHHLAAARVLYERMRRRESRELLEVLDRGEDEQDLARVVRLEGAARLEPACVHRLGAVRLGLGRLVGQVGE